MFSAVKILERMKGTPILVLLRPCRPATIARIVIAIVVFSIQSQFGIWAPSHIKQEITIITPTLADFDAAPTPKSPFGMLLVGTPLNHCSPYSVFRRASATKRVAVFEMQTPAMTTTTASRVTAIISGEIIAKQNLQGSTVTSAQPLGAAIADFVGTFKNKESIESLSNSINQSGGHNGD